MLAPSSSCISKRERGNLYLAGAAVDLVGNLATEAALKENHLTQTCMRNRIARDGIHYHITLLTTKEIGELVKKAASDSENADDFRDMIEKDDPLEGNTSEAECKEMSNETFNKHYREKVLRFCESFLHDRMTRSQDWFILGIGRYNEPRLGELGKDYCLFLVCSYPRATALRKKLGLPPKDFHITLGFNKRDLHDCSKGVTSLLRKQPHIITVTATQIISTPRELVELATAAILGGKPNEKMREIKGIDKTYIQKGRFHYATILLNAAESMISIQKLQRESIICQNPLTLLAVFGDHHLGVTLLLDILEIRCQVLGRAQDFENVVQHVDLWIDILKNTESLEDTDITNLRSIAIGYKGVALHMKKEWPKAYPCLRASYVLHHYGKHHGGGKTRLEAQREKQAVSIERVLAQCCKVLGRDAPLPPLIPFPRTAHLFDTGGTAVSSDDWVLSEKSPFFCEFGNRAQVIAEEKIDGGNLGFSLSGTLQILAQNRSHFVTEADHRQFAPLSSWIHKHRKSLLKILSSPTDFEQRAASQGLILYGEWCVAKHSIKYDKLPGYFIAFDLYDRLEQKFYSREHFHKILCGSGIPCVPVIAKKKFGPYPESVFQSIKTGGMKKGTTFESDIAALLATKSRFATDGGLVEGVVLRIEDSHAKWLVHRAKIVRPDFVQGIQEHWTRRKVEKQTVNLDFAREYCSTNVEGKRDSYCLEPSMPSEGVDEIMVSRERIDPRQKLKVASNDGTKDAVILPRNFSILWEGEIALSSAPTSLEQIQAWKEYFHVSLVLTLTEEDKLPESWFQQVESCTNMFVPVPNYEAPSIDQMNEIVDAVEDAIKGGGSVVVHCGGGKGRAGTVGACLLMKYGSRGIRASICEGAAKAPKTIAELSTHFNSAAAIKFLRATRPGSIETKTQKSFVRKYSDMLWKRVILPDFGLLLDKRQNASTKRIEDSSSVLLPTSKENQEITAKNHRLIKVETKVTEKDLESIKRAQRKAPRCIICMGLPGSGKSTFANSLAKSFNSESSWLILNQDKLGKKECERLARSCNRSNRVILDRCNLKASERATWLKKLNSPPRGDVSLVYFAADAETCSLRIEKRVNHEAIPIGCGRRIVTEMKEKLEPPTRSEAKRYTSIHVVHTFHDAEEVLHSLGARAESEHTEHNIPIK